MYLPSYDSFLSSFPASGWDFPVQPLMLHPAQSPAKHPLGSGSGFPALALFSRTLFMIAISPESTKKAPGAMTKIVMGV